MYVIITSYTCFEDLLGLTAAKPSRKRLDAALGIQDESVRYAEKVTPRKVFNTFRRICSLQALQVRNL